VAVRVELLHPDPDLGVRPARGLDPVEERTLRRELRALHELRPEDVELAGVLGLPGVQGGRDGGIGHARLLEQQELQADPGVVPVDVEQAVGEVEDLVALVHHRVEPGAERLHPPQRHGADHPHHHQHRRERSDEPVGDLQIPHPASWAATAQPGAPP
jgi:hypothetical protein